MSAPRSSGRWKNGVMNVLSTTVFAPAFFATFATAAKSTSFSIGLVGDSIQTSFVSGLSAFATFAASVMSHGVNESPWRLNTLSKSLNVPP